MNPTHTQPLLDNRTQQLQLSASWLAFVSSESALTHLRSGLQNITTPEEKQEQREAQAQRRFPISLWSGSFSGSQEKFLILSHRGSHNCSSFSVALYSGFKAPSWPKVPRLVSALRSGSGIWLPSLARTKKAATATTASPQQ